MFCLFRLRRSWLEGGSPTFDSEGSYWFPSFSLMLPLSAVRLCCKTNAAGEMGAFPVPVSRHHGSRRASEVRRKALAYAVNEQSLPKQSGQ